LSTLSLPAVAVVDSASMVTMDQAVAAVLAVF
jgi:hypothetical protein